MFRNIAKDFRILSSLAIVLSALLVGSLLAIVDYGVLKDERRAMHDHLYSEREAYLKERVERAVHFVDFYRQQTEERLKQTIKERTYEACYIAAGLVQKYRGELKQPKLHHVVRDSLRNIRYNNGRGYFFAINVNGIEELFADKPHLEGKDLTGMQDSNGQFVVKDMLALADESGEGFYSYTWTKPDSDRNDNIKIAFVKYLPELDWVIGTGEYLEDVEEDLKQEVLSSLEAVYKDTDGKNYLFASTWDGLVLSGPAKGRNMLEIQDSNGLFVVKELINKARAGGGFVQYVMPKLAGQRPALKLSYVAGIPEWRWYIGTGEYIDNIESALHSLDENFHRDIRTRLTYITGITLVVLLLNLLIADIFTSKLKKQTNRFVEFFQQAAEKPVTIDVSTFTHSEFRLMGSAANTMLEERNRALQARQESEERFKLSFETNPEPVILSTFIDGTIVDVNKAFELASGIHRSAAIGKGPSDLGLWANLYERDRFRVRLEEYGEVINFEAGFRVHDNQIKTGLISAKLFTTNNDTHILTVIRDISAEKEAKRALLEMDKIKSEFISTAAHELRTPLAAMMGFTELLSDPINKGKFSDDQQSEFLDEIYDRGEALSQIIDDLLDISRIESGEPIELNCQPVEVRELFSKSLALFANRNHDYRFGLDIPDELAESSLNIDRHRINQVLENLFSNAVKYSSPDTEITIQGRKINGTVQFSVVDAGKGMTEEEKSKVFEKFYRADSSNTAVGGLGIGMSVARQIVESHKGEIWVESEKGVGTTFSFTLPLA